MTAWLRRNSAQALAVVLIFATWALARPPAYSSEEQARLAAQFSFRALPVRSASTRPERRVRPVQPQLRRISAWISSVGAAVALADLDLDGLPNDVCLVDPRTDSVTVAPAAGTGRRYRPMLLEPRTLRYDRRTMAPMGCLPGDFDENGRPDMLVYYWGRTPVMFLRRAAGGLSARAYREQELVGGRARWFTDAMTSADVDGDGHLDLVVGNYFRDGARVLDATAVSDPRMQMQKSMSRAYNGGVNRIYLSSGRRGRFREAVGALTPRVARGWTLATGAADLNGDARPELYFANDFGPDRLFVNTSTPGRVRLAEVQGRRTLATPASKVLGHDSFKGMGVDFGDLDGDGRRDIVVSNIAAPWSLEENNFAFLRTPGELAPGQPAPFSDESERLGLARSGWAWDVKLGDFDNDGSNEVIQATGFVRGEVNRWPELHELATGNDMLLRYPQAWPRFRPGDDLSGRQPNAFYVRGPSGRFVDLGAHLGIDDRRVARGIATADVNGDGRLDFAVANQWAASQLYLNRSARSRSRVFLGLDLRLDPTLRGSATRLLGYPARERAARPAVGATARLVRADGRRMVAEVDGGNGHASVRAPQLMFGLGEGPAPPVAVELRWRSLSGAVRHRRLTLRAGWHTVLLAGR